MDYLIAGLGLGAVLAIIGFFLRELGLSHRRSFPRWMPELGAALMVAALIVWIVTAAAFFLGMDDDAALQVVLGSVAVGALGSVVAAAIMARMRKLRVAPATMQQVSQAVEPVLTEPVSSEPEIEPAPEPEPVVAGAPDEEAAVAPATEKNWEEIWRQTWGSEAVRKLVPEAATEEPAEETAKPVDESVLETWETPAETGTEASEESGSEIQPKEAEEEPEADVPGEVVPEFAWVNNKGTPESAESDDIPIEEAAQDLPDPESDQSMQREPSLNGNDPDPETDQLDKEADASNAQSR